MKKILLSMLIILAFATFSFAQPTNDFKKGEFYVGYSANGIDAGSRIQNQNVLHGINLAGVYNFSRYVGLKGEFSAHLNSDTSFQTYVGGIQIKNNSKEGNRVKPFAHIMAGVAADGVRGSTPTVVIGGGLDIRVNRRVSIRLVQVDYNPFLSSDSSQKNIRVGFGIVF
jgi:hypothetical protein